MSFVGGFVAVGAPRVGHVNAPPVVQPVVRRGSRVTVQPAVVQERGPRVVVPPMPPAVQERELARLEAEVQAMTRAHEREVARLRAEVQGKVEEQSAAEGDLAVLRAANLVARDELELVTQERDEAQARVEALERGEQKDVACGALAKASILSECEVELLEKAITDATTCHSSELGSSPANQTTLLASNGSNATIALDTDRNILLGSNETILLGSNETVLLGSNDAILLGSNETILLGSNQTIDLASDKATDAASVSGATGLPSELETSLSFSLSSSGSVTTIDPDETVLLGSAQTILLGSAQTIDLASNQTIDLAAIQASEVAAIPTIVAPNQTSDLAAIQTIKPEPRVTPQQRKRKRDILVRLFGRCLGR